MEPTPTRCVSQDSSQWPMRTTGTRALPIVRHLSPLARWDTLRASAPLTFRSRVAVIGGGCPLLPSFGKEQQQCCSGSHGGPNWVGPSDILSCLGSACGMEEMKWIVSFGTGATKGTNRCHFDDAVTDAECRRLRY